jgi:hypothetical protein
MEIGVEIPSMTVEEIVVAVVVDLGALVIVCKRSQTSDHEDCL